MEPCCIFILIEIKDIGSYNVDYDSEEYSIVPIDRKRLMIALADLDYILVRATHESDRVVVVGYVTSYISTILQLLQLMVIFSN